MADDLPDTVIRGDGQTVDVAGLMRRMQNYESQVGASQADLNAALASARGAAGASAGGAQLEAQGQMIVNAEQMKALVKKQTDDAIAAATVGMTPGAPSEIYMATVRNFQAGQKDLLGRGRMIESKQNQEFFDDPLQWLTNQFTLPFDIAAYNTKVSEQDRDLSFMHGLSQIFDEQARVNASVDVATGTALLAGMDKIALGRAQAASAGSAMAAAQVGLQAVNMRMTLTDNVFKNYRDTLGSAGAEQDRQQRAREITQKDEAAWRANEELKLRQAEAAMRTSDWDSQQRGKFYTQERINRAVAVTGLAPVTADEYYVNPELREKLKPFMFSPAVQLSQTIGSTPDQSMNMIRGFPLAPGMEITRRWMESNYTTLVTGNPNWRSLGAEAQSENNNRKQLEDAKRERLNITVSGNLYSPPPMKSLLTMLGLKADDGKGYKFQLLNDIAPTIDADKNLPMDPTIIFAAAQERIRSGKSTPDQMSQEIRDIFSAIALDLNSQRGYDRFNLPVLGADNGGYKMQLPVPGPIESVTSVDLLNASAIRTYLTRRRARLMYN